MNLFSENVRKKAENQLLRLEPELRRSGFVPGWEQGVWRLEDAHSYRQLYCGFTINNKFLTKVYCMYMRVTLEGCSFESDFETSCEFLGTTKIKGVIFKRRKGKAAEVESLCDDPGLADAICLAAEKFDIETICIRCDRTIGTLSIEIRPYAGAFVWVKFPPIAKQIPLRSDEIAALCELTLFMKEHFSKGLRHTV
ncbi:MAG: hypothetical protein LBP73_07880 [Clostridiales Family XIII bacterium]|jgi:hypothetical protein|nr:hypothetical protein [Clostridiales Family XIII bacterium]